MIVQQIARDKVQASASCWRRWRWHPHPCSECGGGILSPSRGRGGGIQVSSLSNMQLRRSGNYGPGFWAGPMGSHFFLKMQAHWLTFWGKWVGATLYRSTYMLGCRGVGYRVRAIWANLSWAIWWIVIVLLFEWSSWCGDSNLQITRHVLCNDPSTSSAFLIIKYLVINVWCKALKV